MPGFTFPSYKSSKAPEKKNWILQVECSEYTTLYLVASPRAHALLTLAEWIILVAEAFRIQSQRRFEVSFQLREASQ